MNAAGARDHLRDRMFGATPSEFEVLTKMVLVRRLDTEGMQVTAFQGDDGVDVEGVIDEDVFRARLGVQVKRYDEGNTVSAPSVRQFRGALEQGGHQVGSFVTSSSFTGPAVEAAEDAGMALVDGRALVAVMVDSEIGVSGTAGGYELDAEFWRAFEEPEHEDVVPSTEVPLANSFETLRTVLAAIAATDGSRTEVAAEVRRATADGFEDRHADLYGTAGWLLGFVHKDTPAVVDGREVRRWGLTRAGVEYLALHEQGDEGRAHDRLVAAIRGVEIVRRVYDELQAEGRLTHGDLRAVVERETTLSESSVERRASTVANWLAELPEVDSERDGRSKAYVIA